MCFEWFIFIGYSINNWKDEKYFENFRIVISVEVFLFIENKLENFVFLIFEFANKILFFENKWKWFSKKNSIWEIKHEKQFSRFIIYKSNLHLYIM